MGYELHFMNVASYNRFAAYDDVLKAPDGHGHKSRRPSSIESD